MTEFYEMLKVYKNDELNENKGWGYIRGAQKIGLIRREDKS